MSSNIRIRKVVEADLPIFYEHQLDPVAADMAAFPSRAREPFMAHWRTILADDTLIAMTILVDERVAGQVVCFIQDGEREVGYWVGREYWGQGVATEGLRQFLLQVKSRPLYAHVTRTNIGSRRVLEKCGFRLLREDTGYSLEPGVVIEEYVMILEV